MNFSTLKFPFRGRPVIRITRTLRSIFAMTFLIGGLFLGPLASHSQAANVLIFGESLLVSQKEALEANLTSLGDTVTVVTFLPLDLTPFDTVWHVGAFVPLTETEIKSLADFLAAGKGVHLTGENPFCCEFLNDSLELLVNLVVVADSFINVGAPGSIFFGPFSFNPNAVGGITTTPNATTDWCPLGPGFISGVSGPNVLVDSSNGVPVGAVWDSADLVGGTGRLTLLMDVNWFTQLCSPPVIENIQNFLTPYSPTTVFLSYKVRRTKSTPMFEKQEVTLTDQFESDVLFEVKKSKELYHPADKNGEGIIDPDTHLVGYEIKRAKTDPPQPKHAERTNIEVVNQFGTIFVDTKKPDRLLVPSLKDLDIPIPDIDVPDEFPVDHFKCYKVKVKKKICEDDPAFKCREDADCQTGTCNIGFPKGIQVDVVDEFNQHKLYDIKKPKRLCNPVDMNGEGIINPDAHLMCYKVKPAEDEPKHIKVEGIHTNNQFGPLQVDTKKEAELCVPFP